MNRQLTWDGESIKQKVVTEEKKFTPKEILDSLQHVRNQIGQMNQQLAQISNQEKQIKANLTSATEFEMQLKAFEQKCRVLQEDKLRSIVMKITPECEEMAAKSSKETIAKDPEAYTEEQKKKLPYLDFQKNLATHPKVAENISQHIIREFLYETPVFVNPFKE